MDQRKIKSFRKILLKCSGDALKGPVEFGLHTPTIRSIVCQVQNVLQEGTQVALLVGGGNFFRGGKGVKSNQNPRDAIGMMATVMNGLAIQEVCDAVGLPSVVYSPFPLPFGVKLFCPRNINADMQKKRLIILVGGMGHPFFTTDTAAVLRALELNCDVLMKATKVHGVYPSNPKENPDAVLIPQLSYQKVLKDNLRFMDLTSIVLAQENHLPLIVFSITQEEGLTRVLQGQAPCSFIQENAEDGI